MRLRITKVDEYQFLTCLKYSLWGSKSARFKDWQEGDYLAFIVNKGLAGFATVSGKPFHSNEIVWDNGIFPYRIPISFIHVLRKDQRPPVLGEVRDILTAAWGTRYGWGIITQSVLEDKQAEGIIKTITTCPNNLSQIEIELSTLLQQAKNEILALPKEKIIKEPLKEVSPKRIEENQSEDEASLHLLAEESLVRLGKATGCSVCIATNDRNRVVNGKPIGDECLRALPNFGLNEEATRRISLIDIIWIVRNSPVCAFEVETTTPSTRGFSECQIFFR